MKSHLAILCAALELLAGAGCFGTRNGTHSPQILDDQVTTDRVQAALSRAGKPFANVHAQATNGVVTLSGSVSNPSVRARAEQVAQATGRVRSLRDNITTTK